MIAALGDSELATLAAYVPQVVGGDGAAWRELATRLEPLLIELLRRSRTLGPMRHDVDDCRAVMTSVLERLSKDDYRGLRLFRPWAEAHPGKDFGDWIRIVAVNLARDHVSSRLGVAERADDDVPFNKRMLSSLAARLPDAEDERIGFRPSMTQTQLARELLEYAARALDPDQFHALRRWMHGAGFVELARRARARRSPRRGQARARRPRPPAQALWRRE